MPVLDGQAVNQTVTNAAFLDAVDNDTAIGIITLNNSDVSSGTSVTNLQKEHNSAASFMGKSLNAAKDVLPVFSSDEGFSALQSLYARVNALSDKFKLSGGHAHSGGAGDGSVLDFLDLSNTQLIGYAVLATQLTGVTGGSTTVTTEMTGKTNSTGTTVKGVVVINPYNYIPMFNANNDSYLDGSGNKVYGRLTWAAGVWTLTYYSNIAGVETAYSFAGSNTVNWYYQELFDESDRPVYSDIFVVQSDQVAGEVPSATTALKGKTQLATTVTDVASTSSAGTANATVANADHSHQGVHSIKKSGDASLFGDVTFTGTGATTLTQVGNNIQISSTAGTGTVTDVSVTTANGFAGSVATSTTTPAITISTTVTGLLNGNGTSVAAATGAQVNTVVGSADLSLTKALSISETTDTSTGNIDSLSTTNISNIRLTGAAPVLRGIAGGSDGKLLLITNRSGVAVSVKNQDANPSASNRIITGTGADLTLTSDAAIFLKYDATTSRWQIVGGSGSGSGGSQTSIVQVSGCDGLGSTNTKVVRFNTTNQSSGTDITYASSATLGDSFTVNSAGMYAVSFSTGIVGNTVQMAITVNGTALSTDPATPLTYAQGARKLGWANVANFESDISWCGLLATNDVIRCHANLSGLRNDIRTTCIVTKVSN